MKRLNTVLLLVLIVLSILNLTRAQDDTDEQSLPACTAEEMETINSVMDEGVAQLKAFADDDDKSSAVDTLVKIKDVEGYYWGKINNGFEVPECIEKYSLGYVVGRAIDKYFIGATMEITSVIADRDGRDAVAKMTASYAEGYVKDANLDLKYLVPDLYEKYFDD